MTEIETLREALPTAAGTSAIEPVTPERPTMASISKEAAYLRDRNEILGTEVKELHHETVLRTLDERAAVLGMQDPGEILEAVGAEHGLSWSSVARMIGVTPTAIRKWRRGEPITPQNRQRLSCFSRSSSCSSPPSRWPIQAPGSTCPCPRRRRCPQPTCTPPADAICSWTSRVVARAPTPSLTPTTRTGGRVIWWTTGSRSFQHRTASSRSSRSQESARAGVAALAWESGRHSWSA